MAELLADCGIELSHPGLEGLWAYHQLLRERNPDLNLTRIHNFANMVLKLYADSILPGKLVELPSPLLDIGTGPGMPGIPLKLAFPHLEIFLAESRGKRVEFLNDAVRHLNLEGVRVIGGGIDSGFQEPVAGVITRAVEIIGATLERIDGCLDAGGWAVFMKGPHCDEEVRDAQDRFSDAYRLVRDIHYRLGAGENERRLVVFERLTASRGKRKAEAMIRYKCREIESEQNDIFKALKKLLSGRGIRKAGEALVFGARQTREALRDFPERCLAWVSRGDETPPPDDSPVGLVWYRLAPALFRELDLFGTNAPLLLVKVGEPPVWNPSDVLPDGCSLLVPFQDPENVGAVVRSAVAFGVRRIILLAESANPFHPKAMRASGGAALRAEFFQGPSLSELPEGLPVVSLSAEGEPLDRFVFPPSFLLLPGLEGPGLPDAWRGTSVSIPMQCGIESLNAAVATSVALYVWSGKKTER